MNTAPEPSYETAMIPALVTRLRETFTRGHTRPIAWRREQLRQMIAMINDHADDFTEALQADFGKPEFEARAADIGQAKSEAQLALKSLKQWMKPEVVGPTIPLVGSSKIVRDPLGVALIIAPWNYPVGLLLAPAVGAIAAGNCMILKPSEVTPHTSAALARFIPKYLDPDAISVVEGGIEETTALLEERFDHIFYTGNSRIGRIVMEAAAKNLTPVTLELGGKSPCIVDRGVNIEMAARRIAWGKFINAGQTCIAPDYVLAHEVIEEELIAALERAVDGFYGDSPHQSPDYTRVVNRRHHQRLVALLKDERLAFGGAVYEDECFIAPTVLRDVSPQSAVMQEEIFGPILPILTIRSFEEGVDFVNEREKPLALYLFSNNSEYHERILGETSSGGVCINGTIMHIGNPKLPFGGVGPSGMGAYHGRHSFETFSHRKSVLTRGLNLDIPIMYPPYPSWLTNLVKRVM
jgi:aldehyde dehydrogenase (NAD+)